jgi:hypothetical protein
MYILKEFDKLEHDKFESEKELLKLAFKNYEKDVREQEAEKTITKLLIGTSVTLFTTIIFAFVYHLFLH